MAKQSTKDDCYITLLKYVSGENNKGREIGFGEIVWNVLYAYPAIDYKGFKLIVSHAVETEGSQSVFHSRVVEENRPLYLTLEAYFHLLEHRELQEARKSSSDALKMAKWAVGVSAALAIGSIVLQLSGILGLFSPQEVSLDANQFEDLRLLLESRE